MDSYLPRHPSQEKAKVTVASYVKNLGKNILEGHGLSFHGAVGTGKTHLAASVISAALGRQISTYFVTEDGLFSKLRAEWDDHEAEARFVSLLQCVRILVIDDMGTRKPSDYVAEKYENIINERYNKSACYGSPSSTWRRSGTSTTIRPALGRWAGSRRTPTPRTGLTAGQADTSPRRRM